MSTSFNAAVQWLYGLQALGIKFGLSNMRELCRILGNPEKELAMVHVAGTNGKGSTAAFITEIARQAGLRCGLATSPHILDITERIRIGSKAIPRNRFRQLTERLQQAVADANKKPRKQALSPTFFEAIIAITFMYFNEERVDLAVIETGLGGRLDSTNVITPRLSIIMSIGLEHTEYLGNTITKVAREKAGIIKPGVPVLSATGDAQAQSVIEKTAKSRKARLFSYGKEFSGQATGKSLSYRDEQHALNRLQPQLAGDYQVINASVAVQAAYQLAEQGFPITETHIRRGIRETRWPGRLERFQHKPPWLIDCAHNPHAMQALARHLKENYAGYRILAVFAAMKDKDYPSMLATLQPFVSRWILTKPHIPRAERAETLATHLTKEDVRTRGRVSEALALARSMETDFDLVLICGSIFLVGESYRAVKRHTNDTTKLV